MLKIQLDMDQYLCVLQQQHANLTIGHLPVSPFWDRRMHPQPDPHKHRYQNEQHMPQAAQPNADKPPGLFWSADNNYRR